MLTGGASTTYGADAVAGVVNFKMMDDFEGIQINTQFSQYRHDNDGNVVASAADAAGQPYATGSGSDGDITDLTMIMGANFDGGRGNATAFVTYREIEGVTQAPTQVLQLAVQGPLTTKKGAACSLCSLEKAQKEKGFL